MTNNRVHEAFQRLSDILDTLRQECPWDRVQTMESLRYLTIEETYELSEAILTRNENDDLRKELGDLFMHLMFYAKIAEEEGRFDLADVLEGIGEKLVARHPFIYRKEDYGGESWEQIKMHEGRKSVLEGVPASLPPLVKAVRLQEKAAGIGFVQQEGSLSLRDDMDEDAFGDMLFGLVRWAHEHGINADDALCRANLRFQEQVRDYESQTGRNNQKQ